MFIENVTFHKMQIFMYHFKENLIQNSVQKKKKWKYGQYIKLNGNNYWYTLNTDDCSELIVLSSGTCCIELTRILCSYYM